MGYTKDTVLGFSWMSASRILTRVIAFGRIAILARILIPDQFGAFGVAALVLSFLQVITETGINLFLIQEDSDVKKYVNTAWVISIVRGIIISAIIYVFASPISKFFNSESSFDLLVLISVVPLIRGFINPSVVKFYIDLEFKKEFLYRTFIFVIDAMITVGVALITRSAISLVWGIIGGVIIEVILSFIIFDIRPMLVFEKNIAKRIIKRGKWITLGGIFKYLIEQGDDVVVARVLDTHFLGLYQNVYKISTLPVKEIAGVGGSVVLPVYSKIRGDKKRLEIAFKKSALFISFMSIALGLTIVIFSRNIIIIVLGSNWLVAEGALKVLAVFGMVAAIGNFANSLFISLKKQDIFAKIKALQFLSLAVVIVPLTNKMGIVGTSYAALLSSVIILPPIAYYLRQIFRNE